MSGGVPATVRARVQALARERTPPPEPLETASLRAWLTEVGRVTTAALRSCAVLDAGAEQLLASAVEARDLVVLCDELADADRAAREESVARALHELRGVVDAAGLLDVACAAIVTRCGFERAMLSRTDGRRWLPWKARFAGDDAFERRFVAALQQTPIALADAPLERSVVEERRPAIVRAAASDPRTHKPIVTLGLTQSYVVAPIVPAGRVVGFFHGDHHPSGREVDEDDRDALWAFAEGFSRVYERAILVERLADQRRHVESAFAAARQTFDALDLVDLRLARADDEPLPDGLAPLPPPASNERLRALMTDREREVLELLVRGMGNREIAERLVVQVGTVKTHVKAILRKLGAANRAEAIALYVRGAP